MDFRVDQAFVGIDDLLEVKRPVGDPGKRCIRIEVFVQLLDGIGIQAAGEGQGRKDAPGEIAPDRDEIQRSGEAFLDQAEGTADLNQVLVREDLVGR